MNPKTFEEHIEFIICLKDSLDPKTYMLKLENAKKIINKRILISKKKIIKINKQYQIMKTNNLYELSKIGMDMEWVQFYSVLNFKLNAEISKIQSTTKFNPELDEFNNQVTEKLAKQTHRLHKLQQYSSQLRKSFEETQQNKLTKEGTKLQELRTIYSRFQKHIRIEKERNYDQQIDLANKETQKLTSLLIEANAQKLELVKKKEESEKLYQKVKEEMIKSNTLQRKREQNINEEIEMLSKSNFEIRNNILEMKKRIAHLKNEIEEMDQILQKKGKVLEMFEESKQLSYLFQN